MVAQYINLQVHTGMTVLYRYFILKQLKKFT